VGGAGRVSREETLEVPTVDRKPSIWRVSVTYVVGDISGVAGWRSGVEARDLWGACTRKSRWEGGAHVVIRAILGDHLAAAAAVLRGGGRHVTAIQAALGPPSAERGDASSLRRHRREDGGKVREGKIGGG
jgi:hypothetical protein